MDSQSAAGTQERGQTPRERIVRAACLSFARGFDACSISDLALAAGVSRNQLFHYFGSKEQIALAALERASQAWRDEVEQFALMQPEPRQRLLYTLRRIDELESAGQWPYFRLLAGLLGSEGSGGELNARTEELRAHLLNFYRSLFKEMKRSGRIGADFKARPLAALVLACLLGSELTGADERSAVLVLLSQLLAP